MIGHCFNPDCGTELRYLRHGSVYQREVHAGREFHSEFFWLCATCSSTLKVSSNDHGEPSLVLHHSKNESDQTCSRIRRVLRGVMSSAADLNPSDRRSQILSNSSQRVRVI
jgi:RNase P protein component